MDATLLMLFEHNLWANQRLLEVCAGLGDEQLGASAPGTYGRVRDTLVHILAAEQRYVASLTGKRPERPLRADSGFPGFDELRRTARESGEALIACIGGIDPAQEVSGVRQGRPYSVRAGVFAVQAINHATEHRAQVVTILSQQGITPPGLDAWTYGREKGIVDLPPST